jgi:hypothetical protein
MPPGLSFTDIIEFPALTGEGRDVAYFTVSPDFNPQSRFFIVIFFHGFDKPFAEQIERLALASQVAASGANCLLVCPRTAIDRATESNPGKLGNEDYFEEFLDSLPPHVEKRLAAEGIDTAGFLERAAAAPLVVATFSAGHRLASCAVSYKAVLDRLAACVFFDSLYRSDYYFTSPKFVLEAGALIGVHRKIYDQAGPDERDNHTDLSATLVKIGHSPQASIGAAATLRAGVAVMESVDIADHWQIVADASRLGAILAKVDSGPAVKPPSLV